MYAYKVLVWQGRWTSPLYNQTWLFGRKAFAVCGFSSFAHLDGIPGVGCQCGFYASKSIMPAMGYMRGEPAVIALGWGSGKVIIGEMGYRAAEWEPLYAVDTAPLDALIDEMWDNAPPNELTLAILGLEGTKARAHKGLKESWELVQKLGVPVVSLEQSEVMLGDSWAK
jgi:hypothetical protein